VVLVGTQNERGDVAQCHNLLYIGEGWFCCHAVIVTMILVYFKLKNKSTLI